LAKLWTKLLLELKDLGCDLGYLLGLPAEKLGEIFGERLA
jgi:hypothetical protein